VHSDKPAARLLISALKKAGIEDIVLSPGSRNAPLIIETLAHEYEPLVIPDERAAAFTALGMAQQSGKPAVVISTSGSAVLNYYPAVAEAFYARIPLIVVSADRPPYRVDKGEGQTIRQDGVLSRHTLYSVTLPLDGDSPETVFAIRRAVETAFIKKGPVHINVPFEEPLYGQTGASTDFPVAPVTEFMPEPVSESLLNEAERIWKKAGRKMIIVSQFYRPDTIRPALEKLAGFPDTVVLTENLSNLEGPPFFGHIDRLIFPFDTEEWQRYAPDLVITIGNNIISKKIKYLLRARKPRFGHWHAGDDMWAPDTFDALTFHFQTDPSVFLAQLLFRIYDYVPSSDFAELWKHLAEYREKKHEIFTGNLPAGDMMLYKVLSETLREPYIMQWGNSTVVRYAQLFSFSERLRHFANRGTSGIDGTVSTAAGAARKSDKPVLLVTGDLAFQYDHNGLWAQMPDNLKIIVVHNGGGDIFRFIPGPSSVRDYEKYFVYAHRKHYEYLARHAGVPYRRTKTGPEYSPGEFKEQIEEFLKAPGPLIWEINTSAVANAEILKRYFESLR